MPFKKNAAGKGVPQIMYTGVFSMLSQSEAVDYQLECGSQRGISQLMSRMVDEVECGSGKAFGSFAVVLA